MRFIPTVLLLLCLASPSWSRDLQRYAVILTDEAPVRTANGDRAVLESARANVAAAQERVKAQLQARGIAVTGQARTLLNAIFIEASPADAQAAQSLPGVSYIAPLQRVHLMLDRAEQLINVPAAWNALGGISNAGAGMKIAIIDTGIQSSHPAFQDPSLVAPKGFPLCAPADCAYTNNKIIVARSYVSLIAGGPAETSRPDDISVRDRVGHGTAVAMAAAGVTNTSGPETITGVAPKAFLGSYKVFGSPGVNDYTTQQAIINALEDAFTDGMDVAVLSLGSPAFVGPLDSGAACGQNAGTPCDQEAAAVQNAVNGGMTVVVAAGNQGQTGAVQPTLNTISTPADAPNAIAVAATTNSHGFANALTVPGLGSFHSRYGNGPVPATAFSDPLGDVASVGDPLACTALPAASLTGLFAIVQRGTCNFSVKVQNLQDAGAIGALIVNNSGDDTLITPGGLGGTTIPALFVGYDDGQQIRTFLAANPRATASVDPNSLPFDTLTTANQVAVFSSRGPVLGSAALKPDVAAAGADIFLAAQTYDPNGELYSPSGYLVSQGTSFAAPQVGGVAALVKQSLKAGYPGLTALQLKSAIVNTATQDVLDSGASASVLAVGAGKVNAGAAVSTNLLAQPSTVSFGAIRTGVLPLTQNIQLTNIGTAAQSLSVAIVRRTPETNAHLSIDTPNLSLAPGQTGSFNVLLSGTFPTPGAYEGFITVTGAATLLHIPFLYVVGSGTPYNIIALAGDGDDGIAGQQPAFGYIVVQLIDQYGVPVTNYPVYYSVLQGGGKLLNALAATDNYGLSDAQSVLGPTPGPNVYTVTAGGLATTFTATGRLQPTILGNGVVSAANYAATPPAPGSYVSIFGAALAEATQSYSTPYLPVSLHQVSVSFDTGTLSVPGHIAFISPGQINVQIPWELQGQSSVRMKVSIADASGAVYTLPLATYAPALFQYVSGTDTLAASLDENNQLVSPGNPVAQGHVVQLFLNGLGPVRNQPLSGDPAPSLPLATTVLTPTVTIGGLQAQVQFSGLTPGNAALYQINAVVPNTGSGVQNIFVSIGGVASSTIHIPVK